MSVVISKKESDKTLKTFGVASFLNDFGADMIFPLWPIFLTTVLGANMAVVGLIDGIGESLVSVSQAISGYIADKTGKRKIFIWLGYAAAGLARLGYALAPTWQAIVPFRILDRSGKMRGAPRDAIIADISTVENRAGNFGFLRMMDNLGGVCGVLFSIVFFSSLGYNKLFLIAAIPSLIGSFLIWKLIKEKSYDTVKLFKGITLRNLQSRDLSLYIALSVIFALSTFSYSFLLLYAKELGFAVTTIPALYLVYTLTASIFSIPFGKLADKINRKPVLMLSFVLWLLVCVSFIYFHSIAAVIVGFILYGLHLGALEPVQRALVSELATPELRASSLGTFQMFTGLAALPSSIIAGFLWHKINIAAPFYFSAGLTVLALVLLVFVRERKQKSV